MLYQFKAMIVSMFMAVTTFHSPVPAIDIDKINETACLSQAIYKEAGNQSMAGKLAVGNVIMNRTRHPAYPNSVCEVIRQRGQFSFLKKVDRLKSNDPKVEAQMQSAIEASLLVLNNETKDNTGGAVSFINLKDAKYTGWTKRMRKTTAIGDHTFFRFKS